MPTSCGFTALGEHLPITSEPFLEFQIRTGLSLLGSGSNAVPVGSYFGGLGKSA